MENKFLYAARGVHNRESENWGKFAEWSKLFHLKETSGLDYMLNRDLVEPQENEEYWLQLYTGDYFRSGLYRSSEYVLSKMVPTEKFNFLAVIVEPSQDCSAIVLDKYDFLGYELLDTSFEISALTNCGGFDESFLPQDLNSCGLIDDYEKAYMIKKSILENNPDEYHADTNVIAIWRHKHIGK